MFNSSYYHVKIMFLSKLHNSLFFIYTKRQRYKGCYYFALIQLCRRQSSEKTELAKKFPPLMNSLCLVTLRKSWKYFFCAKFATFNCQWSAKCFVSGNPYFLIIGIIWLLWIIDITIVFIMCSYLNLVDVKSRCKIHSHWFVRYYTHFLLSYVAPKGDHQFWQVFFFSISSLHHWILKSSQIALAVF